MAPSTYDQKKSTIVKLAEKECFAETETAKAIYELACLEVKEKYKAKKEEACRDLRQQELKELDEITRLHEAKMEPIKAQQEQKLAAIRKQYGIAVPEAGLQAPKLGASDKNPTASNRALDDTQQFSDTPIPAVQVGPKATTKAKGTTPVLNRKRVRSMDDLDDDESSDYFENITKADEYGTDDFSFRTSRTEPSNGSRKSTMRASAERSARKIVSSASPAEVKSGHSQPASNNGFKTRKRAPESTLERGSEAEQGDDDESICSGPASQARRRRSARHGQPEPGKYRMNAKAWPV